MLAGCVGSDNWSAQSTGSGQEAQTASWQLHSSLAARLWTSTASKDQLHLQLSTFQLGGWTGVPSIFGNEQFYVRLQQ